MNIKIKKPSLLYIFITVCFIIVTVGIFNCIAYPYDVLKSECDDVYGEGNYTIREYHLKPGQENINFTHPYFQYDISGMDGLVCIPN